MRDLFIGLTVAAALFLTGCQSPFLDDLSEFTPASIKEKVHVGQSRSELEDVIGEPFMTAKTQDDLDLSCYVRQNYRDNAANYFFSFTAVFMYTQKFLMVIYDDDQVKDFKLAGVFNGAVGKLSGATTRYYHPLSEEQLARPDALTADEARHSYYEYLIKIRGVSITDLNRDDLEGNVRDIVSGEESAIKLAEDFAGPLKNVVFN